MTQAAEELIAQSLSMSKPADLVSAVQSLDGCGHITSVLRLYHYDVMTVGL
jgi:hypothetical protein